MTRLLRISTALYGVETRSLLQAVKRPYNYHVIDGARNRFKLRHRSGGICAPITYLHVISSCRALCSMNCKCRSIVPGAAIHATRQAGRTQCKTSRGQARRADESNQHIEMG